MGSPYQYEIGLVTPLSMHPFYAVRMDSKRGTTTPIAKAFDSTTDAIMWLKCLDRKIKEDQDVSFSFDIEDMKALRKENIRRNQQHLKEWKHGKACVLCGGTKTKELSLHHVNPSQKKFSFQELVIWGSLQEINEELAKTVILCTRHHRLLHRFWSRYQYCSCQRCIWRRGMQCRCKRSDVWCLNSGVLITGLGEPVKL